MMENHETSIEFDVSTVLVYLALDLRIISFAAWIGDRVHDTSQILLPTSIVERAGLGIKSTRLACFSSRLCRIL